MSRGQNANEYSFEYSYAITHVYYYLHNYQFHALKWYVSEANFSSGLWEKGCELHMYTGDRLNY